jgi:hypothetical protein
LAFIPNDKGIFRDVITLISSTIAQGLFIGNDFNISTVAPYGTPQVQVIRYAFELAGRRKKFGNKLLSGW